jgi:predicted enzyme related to lactoylglutathione lyase
MPEAASIHIVVYAKEAEAVARFYERVLDLARLESESNFVLLAGIGYELSVVAMPEHLALQVTIQSPPSPREETPVKISFVVPEIEALRQTVLSAGGSLKPPRATWSWRGQLHLDGIDPEGNVFQLRQPAA